jgi:hypothetical protein
MKKLLMRAGLAAGTLGLVLAGAAAFSAFEAHVVNVTATINNATDISTSELTFGNVFPEEILHNPVTLSLSTSFTSTANTRATNVDYVIKQKPKCKLITPNTALPTYAQVTENADHTFVCPGGYQAMPLLCPYLSKTSPNATDTSVPSFHGPLTGWTDTTSNTYAAVGHLTKTNPSTTWDIDLHTPCFQGECAQDWASYVHTANATADPNAYMADPANQNVQMGCDLWYELTGVNQTLTSANITNNAGTSAVIGTLAGATLTTSKNGSCNGTNNGTLACSIVDVSGVVVTNGPIADGEYGFNLAASSAQQATLIAYFGAKGWTAPMITQIDNEINGTVPFFFLKVSGSTFSLVDGFQRGLNSVDAPLLIDGTYPTGTYTYTGTIGTQVVTVPLTVN